MKTKVFSIYDSKAELFAKPFHAINSGVVIRQFQEMAGNNQNDIGKYPEDFTLFELAEYDEETGKFTNHPTPISHGVAIQFINKEEKSDEIGNG